MFRLLGLSSPKHTKQSFKVEENIHELDHILGGLWDVHEVRQGECFKFVRCIQFHLQGMSLECTVVTSKTIVPFDFGGYRKVAAESLYTASWVDMM